MEENTTNTEVTQEVNETASTEEAAPQENQDAQPVVEAKDKPLESPEGDGIAKAVEKAARKLKLKVDGIESEYDEDEVIAMAQTAKAAQKRFSEAAKMRKESARFIEMLKEDPQAVLSHPDIGVDVKKFAEEYLLKEIERAEMSPEAKEAYEAKQEVARLKKEAEEREANEAKSKQAELQQHYTAEYEQQIQGALEEVQIPKTAQSVQRMATYMAAALENDVEITAVQAAQLVKSDYLSDVMTLLNQSDGETLLGFLGEDVATKIRKTDLARLEAKLKKATQTQPEGEESVKEGMPRAVPNAETKQMNNAEWREYMEKLRNS